MGKKPSLSFAFDDEFIGGEVRFEEGGGIGVGRQLREVVDLGVEIFQQGRNSFVVVSRREVLLGFQFFKKLLFFHVGLCEPRS